MYSNLWMVLPLRLGHEYNSVHLYPTITFQCVETSLHTLVVAMLGKPWASFLALMNNLCNTSMHKNLNMLANWFIVSQLITQMNAYCV